jgi:hypothetical protein
LLGLSAAIHLLLLYAFMVLAGTTLYVRNRIILVNTLNFELLDWYLYCCTVHFEDSLYLPAVGTTCIRHTICCHTTGGINEVFYRLF